MNCYCKQVPQKFSGKTDWLDGRALQTSAAVNIIYKDEIDVEWIYFMPDCYLVGVFIPTCSLLVVAILSKCTIESSRAEQQKLAIPADMLPILEWHRIIPGRNRGVVCRSTECVWAGFGLNRAVMRDFYSADLFTGSCCLPAQILDHARDSLRRLSW